MLKNKTKIFLLCSILLIAMIGISIVSATDTNDTSTKAQHTTTKDVPTASNNNVDNKIVKDVQNTSKIDSNAKTKTNELTKKVEKEHKNVKEKVGDYSLTAQCPSSITSGSNLQVSYSVDGNMNDDDLVIVTLNLNYIDSSGRQQTLKQGLEDPYGAVGEPITHPISGTHTFTNVRPVSGAQSYYVYLDVLNEEDGSNGYLQPNDCPFTFSDVVIEPSNVAVDSVTFTKIDNRVLTNTDTNVTVVLSNTGSTCPKASVKLTIDGETQTKDVTNLGSTPKSLVYSYNFATEGQKDVSIIVDYLNGTSFTAYTGNVMVTAPTQEDRANIVVNSVSYTKKQNKVITETPTNVTVVVGNNGVLKCDEANIIISINGENQTKTVTNLQAGSTQNLVYAYTFKAPGTKTVKVMVDYLNGTTVEAYTGTVKVEIYYTTVSSEVLTTKASGTVTGGLYHNAIQNPGFDNDLSRKHQSDVTFTFADSYSNITTARLYAVLYDTTAANPSYAFNLTMDGNNDGEYETIIENNHYIGIQSTSDSTVYKINNNITKVYTDYVLFYDVTNYIKSNTINVELNSSNGAIKCIGLIVPYNQEGSGKTVEYWINMGTVWTATETSTTFATKNHKADDVRLVQSIASSANPSTTFNNNPLTYTKNPSGYFGIESWNVTDKYSTSSNMVLKNTVTGPSLKTMAATLELTTYIPTDITVDSVTFTKTQDAVLSYFDTNVTVVVSNDGPQWDEASVTLTVGEDSQTKTITNVGSTPQSIIFEEYFTSTGNKDVTVVIDYLNGTSVTAYTGNVNVIASGYMGKSFSHGANMTVRPVYDGYNTLNVFGHFFGYKSNTPATFTFDAGSKGLVEEDKVVDILYYQPWGTWNGLEASIALSLNNKDVNVLSNYEDQKGFGSYNYPYGLTVYNITDDFVCGGVNNFTVTPIVSSGYAYIYGGYIVAIYANNTNRTVISIAEDEDALSAGTSSSYGATSDTAIAYAKHEGIGMDGVSSAYVVATVNNAAGSDNNRLLINGEDYGNIGTAYNANSQVAIYTVDMTKDLAEDNVIAIQCIYDTSAYVLSSILVVTYEEPVPVVTVSNVTASTYSGSLLALENNTIKVNLTSNLDVTNAIQVKLIVGNYESVQDVDSVSADRGAQVVFENYCPGTAGDVDVSVVIDYLNGTTVTAYTSSMTVYYNGYMGKSFTNNSNMTNVAVYEGYNTVNVFGVSGYVSSGWSEKTFTFDAVSNGIVDGSKVVDVLYYIPYTYSKGLNFGVTVNNEEINVKSSYVDEKGFGSYNYPYGLMVYNLTGLFKANDENTIVLTPGESNNIGLYGTYLVVVYANSSERSKIVISEDCDMLSTTSSSYGATSETAISYANYEDVDIGKLSSSQLIVIAGGSDNTVNVLFNGANIGSLDTAYNSTSQLSIFSANLENLVSGTNNVAVQSVNDNLYTYNSILVTTYEEPAQPLVIEPAESEIENNVTLTASFVDEIGEVNDGKVIFRINGKTLRNEEGKVIYVDVIDGVATLPDVNITSEWMKPETTIQAIYTGTDTIDPIITDPVTITITKKEATLVITGDLEAKAGENVTLSVSVTDKNGNVNTGRVAFKLNGKTLKDADGKALYANVVNGTASTVYTIPAKTKAKTYDLTVVFSETTYERAEVRENFVVS